MSSQQFNWRKQQVCGHNRHMVPLIRHPANEMPFLYTSSDRSEKGTCRLQNAALMGCTPAEFTEVYRCNLEESRGWNRGASQKKGTWREHHEVRHVVDGLLQLCVAGLEGKAAEGHCIRVRPVTGEVQIFSTP